MTDISTDLSMRATSVKGKICMPQAMWGPALWPKVHRSSCKQLLPACVSHALHLVKWTKRKVDLSYFVAANALHSSGCRLQLSSQLSCLKTFSDLPFANLVWCGPFFLSMCFFLCLNLSSFKTKWHSCREHLLPQDGKTSESTFWTVSS